MKKNNINFTLEDPAFAPVIMSADDALGSVIEFIAEGKGDDGSVTIKIKLEKEMFLDGYNKRRDGIKISYTVNSAVQTKSTYSADIPTGQMMLCESDYEGWTLMQAPDPQMTIDDISQ